MNKSSCYGHLILSFQKKANWFLNIDIVFLLYHFKESRQNSTVEEDSEGDNDSEEFYYGGQVSTPGSPNIHVQS